MLCVLINAQKAAERLDTSMRKIFSPVALLIGRGRNERRLATTMARRLGLVDNDNLPIPLVQIQEVASAVGSTDQQRMAWLTVPIRLAVVDAVLATITHEHAPEYRPHADMDKPVEIKGFQKRDVKVCIWDRVTFFNVDA